MSAEPSAEAERPTKVSEFDRLRIEVAVLRRQAAERAASDAAAALRVAKAEEGRTVTALRLAYALTENDAILLPSGEIQRKTEPAAVPVASPS